MTDLVERIIKHVEESIFAAVDVLLEEAATALEAKDKELAALRDQLTKCGKDNCMGQKSEGVATWVREERLIEAEDRAETAERELAALHERVEEAESRAAFAEEQMGQAITSAETAERRVAELEQELKEEEERGDEATRYGTERSRACWRAERERDEAREALKRISDWEEVDRVRREEKP